MSIINFTVEEINLISIYKADTLAATLAAIDEALPDIYDEDIVSIAESAGRKLPLLTEPEFAALFFIPADETESEPDEIQTTPNEGGGNAEVIKESAD